MGQTRCGANRTQKGSLLFHKRTIRGILERKGFLFLSKLLNSELPESLLDDLERKDIDLFPQDWADLHARCSCPDSAVPCKHIAAVIYLACAEIDKNPFVVFTLHNFDLQKLVEDMVGGAAARSSTCVAGGNAGSGGKRGSRTISVIEVPLFEELC